MCDLQGPRASMAVGAMNTGESFSYFSPLGCSLVSRGGRLKTLLRIRAGDKLSLCFSVFEASLVVGGSAIPKSLNRFLRGEKHAKEEGESGEDGKNYALQLRLLHFLHPEIGARN